MADGTSHTQHTDGLKSRRILLRRLTDVVALPDSASSPQDRAIAGDLLLEVLIDTDVKERAICARRLAAMSQAPVRVLRFLANDVLEVSQPILEESEGLDEAELIAIVRHGAAHHRKLISGRRQIGPALSEAITESEDREAIVRMLLNPRSKVSEIAMDRLVALSKNSVPITSALMRRPELRPAHALAMFWWSNREERQVILTRFSAERSVLIDMCSDIFALAAQEGWYDEVVAKALQVIERRQRDRRAIEASDFENLEDVIVHSLKDGITDAKLAEISVFCGIKPMTGKKIFTDPGGEGIAILAKAVGLKRQYFKALWAALGRPFSRENAPNEHFEHVMEIYEMLAVSKAQTVLRYWNWSLSTAFSPDLFDHGTAAYLAGKD